MGSIRVDGIPYAIEIKGDKPNKEEAIRIKKLVEGFLAKKEADNPFTDEKMRKVYETGDEDIIAAVEKAKTVWEKTQGRNILKEFGFGENLPEGLDLIMDRDDAFIVGGAMGSIPGLKELFNIKKMKNIPTNPKDLVRVFGKAWFGGIFGSVTTAQAYDIAQYLVTGKEEYLPTFKQMSQDTREAVFWETIGLLLPEAIPKLARATLDFSDPAIIQARKIAKNLGIQLDIAAQSRIGQLVLKPLGILPFIGGGLRNSKGVRVGQINSIFDDILLNVAPTSKFTQQGISIFNAGTGKFKAMKQQVSKLWDAAYNNHAMLSDPNILNTTMKGGLQETLESFIKGGILREFDNIPVDERGIIKSFDDIVKSGYLDEKSLSRLADDKPIRDFFNLMRNMQKTIADQGGDISYQQLRTWNGNLQSFFNDIVGKGKLMNKEFTKVLTKLKHSLDLSVLPDAVNIMKVGDSELANKIAQSHKDANTYTKSFYKLFESPAANTFKVFVKNVFEPGLDTTKKDIDMMLKAIMKIDSPTTLNQLKEIVGPKVFKQIAKKFVDDAMRASMGTFDVGLLGVGDVVGKAKINKVMRFDPGTLAQKLGFDMRKPTEHGLLLLKEAGIDQQLMKNIIDMGAFESGIKIGDPSSYLMRSAQIKGIQPFLQGFFRSGTGSAMAGGAGLAGIGAGTALQGLFAMMIGRYGITKFLGNPRLAKAANIVFDPARQSALSTLPFTKLPLGPRFWQRSIQDVLDLHLRENPEQNKEDFEFLNDFKDSLDIDSVEFRMFEEIINDLGIGPLNEIDKIDPATIHEQNLQLQKRILEEKAITDGTEDVIVDEQISMNVPQVNQEFDMAQVVSPLPNPVPSGGSAQLDPDTVSRLESVGLPLFANQGGIASLVNPSLRPRQMVA
tara:strand:- start:11309 stop:14002 length:2694 start_codon:yes stop_codon:yes gene_type:complete